MTLDDVGPKLTRPRPRGVFLAGVVQAAATPLKQHDTCRPLRRGETIREGPP